MNPGKDSSSKNGNYNAEILLITQLELFKEPTNRINRGTTARRITVLWTRSRNPIKKATIQIHACLKSEQGSPLKFTGIHRRHSSFIFSIHCSYVSQTHLNADRITTEARLILVVFK